MPLLILIFFISFHAETSFAAGPTCKHLFFQGKTSQGRFVWMEPLAKQVMALMVQRKIFTEGSYFRQDPEGKIAAIIKEVTGRDLKAEGLYFWTRRHVGKWDEWLVANNISIAKWNKAWAKQVMVEVQNRKLSTAGLHFRKDPEQLLATIIYEVTGHAMSSRSLYDWVIANKKWNEWLKELGLETKNDWRWQETQAKQVMRVLVEQGVEFGSTSFVRDRQGVVAQTILSVTGRQTTARGLFDWAARTYGWEQWLKLNSIPYKRNIWTPEDAKLVLHRLVAEKLSVFSTNQVVLKRIEEIIISITGQKRHPKSLYHWAITNYSSWENWHKINKLPLLEKGWNESRGDQLMAELKKINFQNLNSGYFQRDPEGKITEIIQNKLGLSYSPKSLVLWVYRNYGSWDKWLVRHDINPDAVRLKGFAEYSILTVAMQRERRQIESTRQALLHERGFKSGKEPESVEIEIVDSYRLEDDVYSRQVESKFHQAVANLRPEQAEVVRVLLEYVKEYPEEVYNLYGKEFVEFYKLETGKTLNSGVLKEALESLLKDGILYELLE